MHRKREGKINSTKIETKHKTEKGTDSQNNISIGSSVIPAHVELVAKVSVLGLQLLRV
jgi:hypothetical protein